MEKLVVGAGRAKSHRKGIRKVHQAVGGLDKKQVQIVKSLIHHLVKQKKR